MSGISTDQAGPSLNQRRQTNRRLPASAKKARRAIMRDGDNGYVVDVPPGTAVGLEDLVLDQMLRINALELSLGKVNRKLDVLLGDKSSDVVAPFVGEVIPMSRAPAKQDSVSIPVSVPGNEAEALDLEQEQLLAAPYSAPIVEDNVVHIHGAKVPITPAANDEGSPRTTEDVIGSDTLSRIIERKFGLRIGEVYLLAKAEWQRREDACIRKHGVGMTEIKLFREFRHVKSNGLHSNKLFVATRLCESGYADWHQRVIVGTDWKMVKALTAGPAIRKRRAEAKRKDNMKSSNTIVGLAHKLESSVKFAITSRQAEAIKPKRPPFMATLRSKWGATKQGWRDSLDRLDRGLSLTRMGNGFDWFKAERAAYEHDPDVNDPIVQRDERLAAMLTLVPRYRHKVRIAPSPVPAWYVEVLDGMHPRDRLRAISNELVRRKLYCPLDITLMEGQIVSHFGSLADTVASTDA